MELYTLDEYLRRIQVVDVFESLIWAERFSVSGDFQLILPATPGNIRLLREGELVTVNDSYYVGQIDTVEKKLDAENRSILEVKGYFLEEMMKSRVAKKSLAGLEAEPDWELEGSPRDILKEIFYHICLEGGLSRDDKIPFMVEGDLLVTPGSWASLPDALYWQDVPAALEWAAAFNSQGPVGPVDTGDSIIINNEPMTLYDAIKTLCDVFNLGFRIIRNGDKSELYFEIYPGVDRTSLQSYFEPIMFSTDLDNLKNSTEFSTIADSKNVAYVFSKFGSLMVFPPGTDEAPRGFERRVLYVNAKDIEEPAGPNLNRLLTQKGQEELAKTKPINAFEGEITKFTDYVYGKDYNLGDIVELKDREGNMNRMRVAEVIRVHDAEGEKTYPTVVIESRIDKGTWASLPPSLVWQNAQGFWANA